MFQLCNKSFKAKRNLQYHQYMHHGVESKDSNISERFCEARKRKLEIETAKSLPSGESGLKHYYPNGVSERADGHDAYATFTTMQGQQKLLTMAQQQWESQMNLYNSLKTLDPRDENGNRKSLQSLNFNHHGYNHSREEDQPTDSNQNIMKDAEQMEDSCSSINTSGEASLARTEQVNPQDCSQVFSGSSEPQLSAPKSFICEVCTHWLFSLSCVTYRCNSLFIP